MTESKTNKAKDVVFTLIEFDVMFRTAQQNYEEYQNKYASLPISDLVKLNQTKPVNFTSFDHYIEITMNAFAEVSHGDVILIDGEKEVKRVKGNYKEI